MAIKIEDILSIACSSVQLSLSNDFQRVFLLSSSSEARLVFDVLVAHGLDVKVYHQPDDTSKLYITHPTLSPNQLEDVLSAAKAYTITLKQIKESLDKLGSENESKLGPLNYNMTFANLHPKGKQIIIQVANDSASGEAKPSAPVAASSSQPSASGATPQSGAASQAQANATIPASVRQKVKSKTHYEEFSSGPAVGRGKYPGSVAADGTVPEETLKKRILLYLFGNMATSSFSMLIMVVILAILFTIFVFAKAFVCPDFVSMKRNTAWYCHTAAQDEEEEKQQQKMKQLERLGIKPQ